MGYNGANTNGRLVFAPAVPNAAPLSYQDRCIAHERITRQCYDLERIRHLQSIANCRVVVSEEQFCLFPFLVR